MRHAIAPMFVVLCGILLLQPDPAHAVIIDFAPDIQVVDVGTPVDVGVVISGLGDGLPPSLSTFDLDVSFDPLILLLNNVTYGDPILGDQLNLFGLGSVTLTTPGAGTVNLFELSLDDPTDIDNLQATAFTLATLRFDTLGVGTSPLGLSINALGDADGGPLEADAGHGSITARATTTEPVIPEPCTGLLLSYGLVGVVLRRLLRVGHHSRG